MGNKIGILLILCCSILQLQSQTIKRSLISAKVCSYNHNFYAFGYEQRKEQLLFKCFLYTNSLQLKDSTEFNLGKHIPADFLQINNDTLHHFLNFYFQLANQKNVVTLFRINGALKTICSISNYDANHINSLTAFEEESYIFNTDLYIIKTSTDTSGKQFYVSKYSIKATDKPFEYDYKWQFPFERKNILNAEIIYADSINLMLYAHVYDGLKKGQWILRVNAKTGVMIKGTKLNPKNDGRHFLHSKANYHKLTKSIDVVGSIYPEHTIDFKTENADFKTATVNHKLFLIQIDSVGEIKQRIEKPLLTPIQAKAPTNTLHFKIREFIQQKDKNFTLTTDIYEQTQPNVMAYYTTWIINLIADEDNYIVKQTPFFVASKAIPDFISFTKGDTYGKIYLKTISDYDKFKYQQPKNSVVIQTGLDSLNNPFYILKKTTILSGKTTFNYITIGKKGLESKTILTSDKTQNASLFFIDKRKYASFITDAAKTYFELKINRI